MQKFFVLLLCLVLGMSLLSGCGDKAAVQKPEGAEWEPSQFQIVNNTQDVILTVKAGSVSPTGITVVFKNNSGKRYLFSEYMWLEKRVVNEWKQVPVVSENYGFNDIAYILEPNESKEMTIAWEWLHGALDAGEYRLIKDVFLAAAEEYSPFYLAVEFTI